MSKIHNEWGSYYASALSEIKERFKQIDSASFSSYMNEQQQESDRIDAELAKITGDVQQLELDVQSSASTQASLSPGGAKSARLDAEG